MRPADPFGTTKQLCPRHEGAGSYDSSYARCWYWYYCYCAGPGPGATVLVRVLAGAGAGAGAAELTCCCSPGCRCCYKSVYTTEHPTLPQHAVAFMMQQPSCCASLDAAPGIEICVSFRPSHPGNSRYLRLWDNCV
jgi:hypothetical protein